MRLLVHVEGPTEERFVNESLRNHLGNIGFHSVSARLLGNARLRQNRGGIKPWSAAKRDIKRHLLEDQDCAATTMVDYYALPHGDDGWPGRKEAAALPFDARGPHVEQALLQDLCAEMGSSFDAKRFVPFVVMHEFEGLLFSDCSILARSVGKGTLESDFQQIRGLFSTPEQINDSPITAPSKRILALAPEYNKVLHGNQAAVEIGLDKIRKSCPHFDSWVGRLEALP